MLTINKDLQIAIKACLKSGQAIMQVYDSVFNVEYKEDKSPLTEADKKANEIINSFLEPTNIPIISEENKQINYNIRKNWNICWIVDPLDGTKEFVKRNGEFTVNIALVRNGEPYLGVIYAPATKTLYFADLNIKKAYKLELDSHQTTIKDVLKKSTSIKPNKSNSNLIRVVGSRSHMNQETLKFIENLKSKGNNIEVVSIGSSLKFCLIAEGHADVYPRFAPTMEWDTAAGQAICSAVGIKIISNKTNKSLLYNKKNLLNDWFLASKNDK